MRSCSVVKRLRIAAGTRSDYDRLSCYHYRDGRIGVYAAIFALKYRNETVGVIVYTMPSVSLELRNVALGDMFSGLDRTTSLAAVNKTIRCIGRVIIEPRFRGLGLASMLVRETMDKMDVPIIEAVAVMGHINPFFEKAGMTAYKGPIPARAVQLIEAFSMVGIERSDFVFVQKVQRKIEALPSDKAEFIASQMGRFLQSYGKRRLTKPGIEQTEYVLSKLTDRPVYYIWIRTGDRR